MTGNDNRNLITDVEGVRVGQAQDAALRSGVSVVLLDAPAQAAVDVRGGAPGSRELAVLDPVNLVGRVDAVVLSGGSAFGLDAASGVTEALRAQGRGFRIAPGAPSVPIVPAAVLFDLTNGGDKGWARSPYGALGHSAALAAGCDVGLGNHGAGYGAVAGAYKGGIGSVSVAVEGLGTLGVLVAVNALGSPVMPGSNAFWAWPFERCGEFGGARPSTDWRHPGRLLPDDMKTLTAGGNTTIAIVAVEADLSQVELKRLAIMAADGFARALCPVHTPFDGDIVFALSTGKCEVDGDRSLALLKLGAATGDAMARAIARGVYEAETLGALKSYRETFGP